PTGAPGLDQLLELSPRPWPPPLADAMLDALDALLRRPTRNWRVADLCRLAATRLPVTAAPKAAALLDALSERGADVPPAVARLADVLRFRHDMLGEL